MAKDAIEKIKAAEARAAEIKTAADRRAAEIAAEAERRGQSLCEAGRKEADRLLDESAKADAALSGDTVGKMKEAAKAASDELKEKCRGRMEDAIRLIIGGIDG